MKEQEKIIREYTDPIEERQIRHFACKEMGRQIHRYIKAMKGSKAHMLRFEEALEALSLEEKEKALWRGPLRRAFFCFLGRRRGREIFFCNHEFFPKGNML